MLWRRWKKIKEADVGQRLLRAMHHGRTYILICFYIFVLIDIFLTCLVIFQFSDFISFSFDINVLSSPRHFQLSGVLEI